uniref:UTRA domain-containing protein n=1 Tax=Nonomuraea bangladeshensis TaxID=404385 RepID=UPI003F4939E2
MAPASRVLEFRLQKAERAVTSRLRIPKGDPVGSFTRLRLADDVPMVVERATVRAGYVPGLQPADLNGSLYELLATRYGIQVVSGTSKVGAGAAGHANRRVAGHTGHPALPGLPRHEPGPARARLRVHPGSIAGIGTRSPRSSACADPAGPGPKVV